MRKTLKVLSILMIIGAVLSVVLSALMLAGGSFLSSVGLNVIGTEAENVSDAAVVLGVLTIVIAVLLIICAIFELITGIFGVRGANGTPSCAGKAKVLGIITLALTLVSNVMMLRSDASAKNIISTIVSLALQGLFVYAAHRVQHEDDSLESK